MWKSDDNYIILNGYPSLNEHNFFFYSPLLGLINFHSEAIKVIEFQSLILLVHSRLYAIPD